MIDPNKPKVPQGPADPFFGDKKERSIGDALWKIKRGPSEFPDSGGARFPEQERIKTFKEYTKNFGNIFDPRERAKLYKNLDKKIYQSKTSAERLKNERTKRYYKKVLG